MKSLIFIQSSEVSYSGSNTSRFLYIADALKKSGIDSLIIGSYPHRISDTINNNVLMIKPILSQDNVIGRIVQKLQIQITAIKHIIITHGQFIYVRGYDLFPIALFAKIIGRDLIYDFHGYRYIEQIEDGVKYPRVIIAKLMDKLLIKLSDYISVVSPGIQHELPQEYLHKSIVLQNGIDINVFAEEFTKQEITNLRKKYNILPDKKVVGFVASSVEKHYIDDLIEFQEYIDNVYSVIICDLRGAPHLVQKAREHNNVILTNFIPHREVVILLKYIIDVCIIPFNKDSYGAKIKNFFSFRKASEYVAVGKPIIISDIEGTPSFLKEGVNYIPYESKDPKDLAEKIKLLLEDDNLYQRLRENNLKLAKEITWENRIKQSGLIEIISGKR
jgi:glycosyltransferase involved in cell wall biosynthesis